MYQHTEFVRPQTGDIIAIDLEPAGDCFYTVRWRNGYNSKTSDLMTHAQARRLFARYQLRARELGYSTRGEMRAFAAILGGLAALAFAALLYFIFA